jgi:hypothetical protein
MMSDIHLPRVGYGLAAEFTVLNVSKPAHTTGPRPFMPKIVSDLAENLYRASRRCVYAVIEFGNERTIVAVATYTFGDHATQELCWQMNKIKEVDLIRTAMAGTTTYTVRQVLRVLYQIPHSYHAVAWHIEGLHLHACCKV